MRLIVVPLVNPMRWRQKQKSSAGRSRKRGHKQRNERQAWKVERILGGVWKRIHRHLLIRNPITWSWESPRTESFPSILPPPPGKKKSISFTHESDGYFCGAESSVNSLIISFISNQFFFVCGWIPFLYFSRCFFLQTLKKNFFLM